MSRQRLAQGVPPNDYCPAVRTDAAAQGMARLPSTAVNLHRVAGANNIAEAGRITRVQHRPRARNLW